VVRHELKDDIIQTARHLSIFAVSAFPAPGDDDAFRWEEQTHKPVFGFRFDIDHRDIQESIRDRQKLLDTLVGMGVDLTYVEIFASGSKGFHVLVPALYYSSGKANKYLPQIYRWMAARIKEKHGIQGLDLNLYHGKRGSLLRLPNQVRSDGKYKVPITVSEARSITPEFYAAVTAAPRQIAFQTLPNGALAAGFASLFEQSKADVKKHLRQGTKTQSVPDEVLAKFGDGLTPKCVDWMTNGERCKSAPFNAFGMQVEIYLAKAPVAEAKADELRESLVLHGKSDRMRTQSERRDHLRQLCNSVDKEAYTFSCRAMRKLQRVIRARAAR
jgi:hypothetical protein